MPALRRLGGVLLLGAAALLPLAPAAAAESGFALVRPAEAEALARRPNDSLRAQAIRFADRQLDRAPHAMARVHVEGTLPHQGIYDESREALRDLPAARELAVAARLTGESRYAVVAMRLIAAWCAVYRPSFNPIDETGFDALMLAYDLMPPDQRQGIAAPMQRLMKELAEGYLARMEAGLKGGTATNNWQSHRVKLAALAAYATGEAPLVARARRGYAAQLAANLKPDGSTIDFAERDAIHYVVYDLEPLATAALAAQQHGEDWYGLAAPTGATLAKSLDWLLPYAEGSREHLEFVHSTVRFDAERRAAGVPGFDGAFEPRTARLLYATAARLDSRYAPLSRNLGLAGPWLELIWPAPK